MPQHLTQGHTYAIGLSQRANLAEAANTARAQGWSLPPAYLAGPIFYGGWSPVVYYAVQASPVAPPPDVAWLTQWIAIAYRSGQSATVQGYAGEVSALSPFGPELTFVQDLNAPPSVVRSLVADPAPGSPSWEATAAPAEPERYTWVLPWILGGAALTGAWALWGPSKRVRRNPPGEPRGEWTTIAGSEVFITAATKGPFVTVQGNDAIDEFPTKAASIATIAGRRRPASDALRIITKQQAKREGFDFEEY
jgi:hypothetical protein